MLAKEKIIKGRKRNQNSSEWKRNLNKKSKNEGQSYVSDSGKIVRSKEFNSVNSCCPQECFRKVDIPQQRELHENFWKIGDYHGQNVFLRGIMRRKISQATNVNCELKRILWDYVFHTVCLDVIVCQNFLLQCLQINRGRFATVQKKIIAGDTLKDGRGRHENHYAVLTAEIKELIYIHCNMIQHSEPHYTRENSTLKYFQNSDLTLKKMYELFLDFYAAVKGDDTDFIESTVPLSRNTYEKYFNYNVDFTFSAPRTDVCNFCFLNKNNAEMKIEFLQHIDNVKSYRTIKNILSSTKNALCLVFDFGQNLPLPKLSCSEQFYLRLLWLYIFNIHVLSDPESKSYMFPMLEGNVKKGSNTVINLLFYVIMEEYRKGYFDKIILFSDACGGQNRNYNVLHFLSLLSKKMQVEIEHLYPVRGHSYCQCDANFGMYGKIKKNLERIETPEEYIELIKNSRNPPFEIVQESDYQIKDFEQKMEKRAKMPKQLQISKAVRIKFFPNGTVDVFTDYNGKPKNFLIDSSLEFDEILHSKSAPCTGINAAKLKDLRKLIHYLSLKGKIFFENFCHKMETKNTLH